MKPLVSIIIPAYNAQEWVAEAIQSAVAQTWPRKEIIVVNDGSTDRTGEVAQHFASSGVRVFSTANQGLSAAINYGYRLSQGDYIQELDADDVLAPEKIERQLSALRQGTAPHSALLAVGPIFLSHQPGQIYSHGPVPRPLPGRVATAENGPKSSHAECHLAGEPRIGGSSGTLDERLYYDQDGEYFARVL